MFLLGDCSKSSIQGQKTIGASANDSFREEAS
jgi:hypothetical protein